MERSIARYWSCGRWIFIRRVNPNRRMAGFGSERFMSDRLRFVGAKPPHGRERYGLRVREGPLKIMAGSFPFPETSPLTVFSSNGNTDIARALNIYYHSRRTSFWLQNDRGGWIMVNLTTLL